jgi:tetratricopeptide (TPR) repeat protein
MNMAHSEARRASAGMSGGRLQACITRIIQAILLRRILVAPALMIVLMIGMATTLGLAAAASQPSADVHADPLHSDPMVREAYQHFYVLDYPACVVLLEKVHAAHPGDPAATTLLLEAEVFAELYRQDLLDTTFYANDGFLTGKHPMQEDTGVRDRIFALEDEVEREAESRLGRNSRDVDALYARGWARSLRSSYVAMVERSFRAAFHMALQAHSDEAKVLEIDPAYVDAKLVVGTYQYVIGALPWGFKLLFGFAGITGSKTRGMEMLHDDFARGPMTSIEAGTVIALFQRREAHYQEAIGVVRSLEAKYPHDFLFCLEEANLRKDAGEGMAAVTAYRNLLNEAAKPGYFPSSHLELAYFGLGEALRGQRHFAEAAQAYEQAAWAQGSGAELKRRSLVAAGKARDLNGERAQAVQDYQAAIGTGSDTTQGDIARRLIKTPYREQQN